jgi:hypothetical protein
VEGLWGLGVTQVHLCSRIDICFRESESFTERLLSFISPCYFLPVLDVSSRAGCATYIPLNLLGIWMMQVACGETHSVALTVDGQVRRKRALVFEPHTQLPNLLRGSSLICPMFEKDVPNVTVLYTRANGYDDVIL